MRYKIVITTPEKDTAIELYNLIRQSKLYNSSAIITLNSVKEVCDECAGREI